MVEEEIFKSKIDKKQPPPTFLLPTEPLSPLYCSQKNCLEAPLTTTAAPPSETKDETEKRGNKNRKKKQRRNKEKKE